MKNLILLTLLLGLSATTFVSAQSTPTQKELFASTYHTNKTAVNSQQYQIVAEVVYTNAKRERLNSEKNRLTINKSKITGQLVSLKSDDKSIDVTGEIQNYNVVFNDEKQEISMSFDVSTTSGSVAMVIEIKPNGNVFVKATSAKGSEILWTARLKK